MKKIILVTLLLLLMSSIILSETAFEKIEFLDSKSEVSSKIKESDTIKTLLFGTNPHIFISGSQFMMEFEYHDDQLYQIKFRGSKKNANYFSTTIIQERDLLVEVIQGQYSKPHQQRELSFLDIDSYYINWSHIWELEKKRIKVGIGETESEYYSALWIEYLPIIEKLETEEQEKDSESVESTSNNF